MSACICECEKLIPNFPLKSAIAYGVKSLIKKKASNPGMPLVLRRAVVIAKNRFGSSRTRLDWILIRVGKNAVKSIATLCPSRLRYQDAASSAALAIRSSQRSLYAVSQESKENDAQVTLR
ncbi:hypothetical protein FQA39_LY00476 [Lamprigera yunnana]|nr:hypothetical protein FQA39_LY00476 [Lamprigera yunnana]